MAVNGLSGQGRGHHYWLPEKKFGEAVRGLLVIICEQRRLSA